MEKYFSGDRLYYDVRDIGFGKDFEGIKAKGIIYLDRCPSHFIFFFEERTFKDLTKPQEESEYVDDADEFYSHNP